MFSKKLALLATAVVLAAVFAMALTGCDALSESNAKRAAAAEEFGTPELPVTQGILDLSPSRAVTILENFEYREHQGVGQWASSAAMFDVYDNGGQATLDAGITAGEPGWILQLNYADGTTWRTCTIEDLKAGADPDKATFVVFPSKGASFDTADRAIEFIDALFLTRMGSVAVDTDATPGHIVFGAVKNPTGAAYRITEEDPGRFYLDVYPSSSWIDGSYNDLVAECQKQAAAAGCEYREFTVSS